MGEPKFMVDVPLPSFLAQPVSPPATPSVPVSSNQKSPNTKEKSKPSKEISRDSQKPSPAWLPWPNKLAQSLRLGTTKLPHSKTKSPPNMTSSLVSKTFFGWTKNSEPWSVTVLRPSSSNVTKSSMIPLFNSTVKKFKLSTPNSK